MKMSGALGRESIKVRVEPIVTCDTCGREIFPARVLPYRGHDRRFLYEASTRIAVP